jgi:hypothetical protein
MDITRDSIGFGVICGQYVSSEKSDMCELHEAKFSPLSGSVAVWAAACPVKVGARMVSEVRGRIVDLDVWRWMIGMNNKDSIINEILKAGRRPPDIYLHTPS